MMDKKVKYKKHQDEEFSHNGIFHQWIVLKDNNGTEGVHSIIQDDKGKIELVYYTNVIFLTEGGNFY